MTGRRLWGRYECKVVLVGFLRNGVRWVVESEIEIHVIRVLCTVKLIAKDASRKAAAQRFSWCC